jgi:hypothetical protein
MSLGSVLRFLFDAFIGGIIGHIGAALLNKLPSFYNYKHRKAITYAVIIVFAFLGVYFNITQQPAIFINLAFELHPAGIAGTIVLLAIFISILYIGIADVLKSKNRKKEAADTVKYFLLGVASYFIISTLIYLLS